MDYKPGHFKTGDVAIDHKLNHEDRKKRAREAQAKRIREVDRYMKHKTWPQLYPYPKGIGLEATKEEEEEWKLKQMSKKRRAEVEEEKKKKQAQEEEEKKKAEDDLQEFLAELAAP